MFGAMMVTVGQLWQNAQKRVNNFTKARAMLDLMANDIQAGVFRSELSPISPTSSRDNLLYAEAGGHYQSR